MFVTLQPRAKELSFRGCVRSDGAHQSALDDADGQPLLHHDAIHPQAGVSVVMWFRAEPGLNELNRHRFSSDKNFTGTARATRGQHQLVNPRRDFRILCPIKSNGVGSNEAPSIACHDYGVNEILYRISWDDISELPRDVYTLRISDNRH